MHKPDDRQLQRAIELLPPLHDLPAALRVRLQTESQLLHLPAGYTLFHEQAACGLSAGARGIHPRQQMQRTGP